jgi:hypothetical protein
MIFKLSKGFYYFKHAFLFYYINYLCVQLYCTGILHRNQSINRKGAYILGDIHDMDHFCTKLAPPPYNKPRSCVSKIYTPMVMVWFGNV